MFGLARMKCRSTTLFGAALTTCCILAWTCQDDAGKPAVDPGTSRSTDDAWLGKVIKFRDHCQKDIRSVPDLEMRYFYDTAEIPRPYLFIVEDVPLPAAEASARLYGPPLAALRKAFSNEYEDTTGPAGHDEEQHVVPIYIFASRGSYDRYRSHNHTWLPMDEEVGLYFVKRVAETMVDVHRGALYVWQQSRDKQFLTRLLHEATHQLMHNASQGGRHGNTPWIQEGMAEYWSGFRGNAHAGWTHGVSTKDRYKKASGASNNYYFRVRGHGNVQFHSTRWLLGYTAKELARDRIGQGKALGWRRADLCHVLGSALVYFFYNHRGEDGEPVYRSTMKKMIRDELRGVLTPATALAHLGISDDTDWAALDRAFFYYVSRTMRSSSRNAYVPGLVTVSVPVPVPVPEEGK